MASGTDAQPRPNRTFCFCERGELTFGENGAVRLLTDKNGGIIREMDDFETADEMRSRFPELATIAVLAIIGSTALVLCGLFADKSNLYKDYLVFAGLLLAVLFLSVCAVGCYSEAIMNDEVGSKRNGLPGPTHITGLGGAVALFLAFTIAVIFFLGQLKPYDFELPESVGNGTIVLLALLFAFVFLSSRIPAPKSVGEILERLRSWTSSVQALGKALSKIDAILVYGVAPIGGVTINNPFLRYFFLLSQIACGGLIAWFCPNLFGLIGAVWVFVLVFAVVRRWGWIEHSRAYRLQNPDGEPPRRIRQIVDLRDEAMVSLLLLVLVMPVAMRQVHFAVPSDLGFTVTGDAAGNFFSWTGFFGIELLKALPFLDWADIYGAKNGAKIHTNGAISMHAVFVARMIIDLVFLAALVQWVSISVAIEKNKRDFLSGRNGVTSLDDRIERNHLSRLVVLDSNGNYVPTPQVHQYTHYDSLALARLKLRHKHDVRLLAAIREIAKAAGKQIEVPSEQLLEECFRLAPRPERLIAIMDVIEQERDFDLEHLLPARSELNRKGRLENERKRLVQLLVWHVPPSVQRDVEFAKILSGENADSLRDVRRLVIDTLVRNAKRNPDVLQYVRQAAENDVSKVVRDHAKRTLAKFGHSLNLADDSKKSA